MRRSGGGNLLACCTGPTTRGGRLKVMTPQAIRLLFTPLSNTLLSVPVWAQECLMWAIMRLSVLIGLSEKTDRVKGRASRRPTRNLELAFDRVESSGPTVLRCLTWVPKRDRSVLDQARL